MSKAIDDIIEVGVVVTRAITVWFLLVAMIVLWLRATLALAQWLWTL